MRLAQRIRQLEKTVTTMTETDSGRELLIVLSDLSQIASGSLIGYKDGSGTVWPMDRTQWPAGQRPHGTLEELWSDPVVGEQPPPTGETRDPLHDYEVLRYFTLNREEYEALHSGQDDSQPSAFQSHRSSRGFFLCEESKRAESASGRSDIKVVG